MKCDAHPWTIRLCTVFLIFGARVLCERRLAKRQTVSTCSVEEFQCSNGHCVDSILACDGRADCADGSDETQKLCTQLFKTCPSYLFRCKYGACVSQNVKCDGKNDCVDGSDESLAACTVNKPGKPNGSTCQDENEYRCKSGQCIDSTSICDGVRDCSDGSDETRALCKDNQCAVYLFKCSYGGCVNASSRCDNVIHCHDGSDEAKCFNSTTTARTPMKPTPRPTLTNQATQSNSKKVCVIPNVEGTKYSYNSTNGNAVLPPGSSVNENVIVEENCEEGYHKAVPYRFMICSNGNWNPFVSDRLCLKKCRPLKSDSLDLKCNLDGKYVDCSLPSIPGTTLIPSCKVTHSIPNGGVESPVVLLCLPDGQWRGDLYTCTPNCGRPYIPNEALIYHGKESKYGAAPWNVGIYRKNEQNNYEMICGGSLITTNLVVSAAHCFWNKDLSSKIIRNDNSLYKIGVGKYNRNISVKDNDHTQIMDVGLIYLNDDYYGSAGFHANDIAIVLLTKNVQLSNIVMPVCVDWFKRYTVQNGAIGKVVGWGQTESGPWSPVLLEALLPYIDQKTCREMYSNEFKLFVTSEKFCAGSKLGQGVHSGDSGAGLTFVHSALHYLTGITSIKNPNENESVAVFTDVTQHITWIRTLYDNFTYAGNSKNRANNPV